MRTAFNIAFLLLAVSACQQTAEKPSSRPILINECFVRSAAEREKLKAQASQGNWEACVELSDYYSFIKMDDERALYWLKRAVALQPNNNVLKHNLKVMTTGEEEDD